jgi:hypothetical protein
VFLAHRAHVISLGLSKPIDVDMANATIPAIPRVRRPAHHFDALVTFATGKRQNFLERQITKNRSDKS